MRLDEEWVLFDVGNVLIGFDHATASQQVVLAGFPPEGRTPEIRAAMDRFLFATEGGVCRNVELDRGRRDLDWLRHEVCRHFGLAIDEASFAAAWTSIFSGEPNHGVVECAEALRRRGANVAICSNTNRAHWQFLLERHPALGRLGREVRCFLSFELGIGKADQGFFSLLMASTGAPSERHLLVDDREENCAAATAAGLRTVLFDPADIASSIRQVLQHMER